MKTGIKVADAMSSKAISVTPKFSVLECAKLMAANKIGALLIAEGEKTIGIVTERDIVRKAAIRNTALRNIEVSEIMERKLITVQADEDLYDAITAMNDYDVRHLPVMRKNDVVGFLTIKDILRIEPGLFEVVAETDRLGLRDKRHLRYSLPRDAQEIENLD